MCFSCFLAYLDSILSLCLPSIFLTFSAGHSLEILADDTRATKLNGTEGPELFQPLRQAIRELLGIFVLCSLLSSNMPSEGERNAYFLHFNSTTK